MASSVDFPDIKPTSRSYNPGTYPSTTFESLDGTKTHLRFGNKRVNATLTLGFSNITEQVVVHQSRKYGVTKFGLERFVNGFLDLLTITFVSRFGKKPMHFFGVFGSLMFVLGFVLFTYIGGTKLYLMINSLPATNIANMSGFYIALASMIIGVQLFLAGFIAEMISRNTYDRNNYQVEKEI